MSHSICENIKQIELEIGNAQLVVVSKYRSLEELETVYSCGHRHFGENRVQELVEKQEKLPKDIKWHVIGHLQTNKVKYIVPFVHLIHSIDSLKLLKEVNKQAKKLDIVVSFLFQIHIAEEDSKFGLSAEQLSEILISDEYSNLHNISCKGIMGMATNTDNQEQIKSEFQLLNDLYLKYSADFNWTTLSMGMSSDYSIAISSGSNMIRVGSKIFNT